MMKVHLPGSELPPFNKAVVTIGTFDGLHHGHRELIALMKAEAETIGGETVIITFHPHPREVVGLDKAPVFLLNTLDEKRALLASTGIDHLVVIPFTAAFSELPAEAYISEFLVKHFHPHTIIIGYDHRFGNNRKGDYRLLEEKAKEYHYQVKEIPELMLSEITVSSTRIREALLQGRIAVANELLGYPYFFSGTVINGNQLGRTIGYPTANMYIADARKLIPGNGVYAVQVLLDNAGHSLFQGMMNIGVRPTVNGTQRSIEVNLFDFDADIYGETLTIYLHEKLRDEVKFNGLEELKMQLATDKIQAIEALS